LDILFNSIGFKKFITKASISSFTETILNTYDKKYVLAIDNNTSITSAEFYKYYGDSFGICIRGNIDSFENFTLSNITPFFDPQSYVKASTLELEVNTFGSFMFIEEEYTGNQFLFNISNLLEYTNCHKTKVLSDYIKISALSAKGTVLLPLEKDYTLPTGNFKDIDAKNYNKLLTSNDTFTEKEFFDYEDNILESITKYIINGEDFLTVIDGFFVELKETYYSYSILGDIKKVKHTTNKLTNEACYILTINTTGTTFEVLINSADLLGIPTAGMRFMGVCIFHGVILFK
jgi:hypothetical protein